MSAPVAAVRLTSSSAGFAGDQRSRGTQDGSGGGLRETHLMEGAMQQVMQELLTLWRRAERARARHRHGTAEHEAWSRVVRRARELYQQGMAENMTAEDLRRALEEIEVPEGGDLAEG